MMKISIIGLFARDSSPDGAIYVYLSCGKLNKYFKKYLPEGIYLQYLKTYPDSSYAHFWDAIDASCALFHQTAQFVAERSGYPYPQGDEDGFYRYAGMIKKR